jgi:peptidoglycan L-alanyl-D-glutamate endopeptidase CwlK
VPYPQHLERLEGVHPDLTKVVLQAFTLRSDLTVLQGLRTVAEQAHLVSVGASTTGNSRHLDGHAVDLAVLLDDEPSWHWPLYTALAATMRSAADAEGVPLEWGGDWDSFKDGCHFQLPWAQYPRALSA